MFPGTLSTTIFPAWQQMRDGRWRCCERLVSPRSPADSLARNQQGPDLAQVQLGGWSSRGDLTVPQDDKFRASLAQAAALTDVRAT
jgi:hypothetical protein